VEEDCNREKRFLSPSKEFRKLEVVKKESVAQHALDQMLPRLCMEYFRKYASAASKASEDFLMERLLEEVDDLVPFSSAQPAS